ncbi:MAG: hypothetical protein BWK80_52070 [Desulfobacteraceae bacterium IS3]|jgi:hypothetical protein|nr:MAG: hypothetical protein BWK80_52070 [Desulfobacteraceae bacterium IS3]
MAGQIKQLIDTIIVKRSKGLKGLIYTTKAKLLLKGIDPDGYNEASDDNPLILERIRKIAVELGVDMRAESRKTT